MRLFFRPLTLLDLFPSRYEKGMAEQYLTESASTVWR